MYCSRWLRASGAALLALSSSACGLPDSASGEGPGNGSAAGGGAGSGSGGEAGTSGTGGESGSWYPNIELGFNPSNFDLEGETRDSVEDLVVSSDCEVLTEQGLITCADPSTYSFRRIDGYAAFFVRSLTIEPSATLTTSESAPVICRDVNALPSDRERPLSL